MRQGLSDEFLKVIFDYSSRQNIEAFHLETVWFQDNCYPVHNAHEVREYLNNAFPNSWIGRGGEISWPARSPDLTPCAFLMWGHLKNTINRQRFEDIEQLKAEITNEF
ncbi:hypothetical protein CBL_02932 [Carabus blaptoides fortunei]